MSKKPWILVIWPILFVGIALSLPAQIMWLYGHGPSEFWAIANKLTFFNWLVMAGLFTNAYGVNQAKTWVRYSLPVLIGIVAINNFFVGLLGTDYSGWTSLIATVSFLALNIPLASKELIELLNNPARVWWREAERSKVHVPVKLNGLHNFKAKSETFNVSSTGMFVPLNTPEYVTLKDNQLITIVLSFNGISEFRCEGRVVRHSPAHGPWPQGIGIQFIGLSWSQRVELERYLKRTLAAANTEKRVAA